MPTVDEIIREAMERGEFDNLPGAGKPMDLSAYFDTPEEVRLAHSVLKGANFLPQEVELLKEIEALTNELEGTKDSAKRERLLKSIRDKRLNFSLMMERLKRQKA